MVPFSCMFRGVGSAGTFLQLEQVCQPPADTTTVVESSSALGIPLPACDYAILESLYLGGTVRYITTTCTSQHMKMYQTHKSTEYTNKQRELDGDEALEVSASKPLPGDVINRFRLYIFEPDDMRSICPRAPVEFSTVSHAWCHGGTNHRQHEGSIFDADSPSGKRILVSCSPRCISNLQLMNQSHFWSRHFLDLY